MVFKPWVLRLMGRLCTECDGSGFVILPNVRNVQKFPCEHCLGTGLRVVQRSEAAIKSLGMKHERGRPKK